MCARALAISKLFIRRREASHDFLPSPLPSPPGPFGGWLSEISDNPLAARWSRGPLSSIVNYLPWRRLMGSASRYRRRTSAWQRNEPYVAQRRGLMSFSRAAGPATRPTVFRSGPPRRRVSNFSRPAVREVAAPRTRLKSPRLIVRPRSYCGDRAGAGSRGGGGGGGKEPELAHEYHRALNFGP
jgi:hypothetical protein